MNPTRTSKTRAETVPAGAYPALCNKSDAPHLARVLKSKETIARAVQIIKLKTATLRAAILEYVETLERALQTGDAAAIYDMAHEIRGLAATAGLTSSGTIADCLCHYLDAIRRAELEPEQALLSLHVGAIGRSARANDEATRLGGAVAAELCALVERRLGEVRAGPRPKNR